MKTLRSRPSLPRNSFVAEILGKPNRAEVDAFLAAVLDRRSDPGTAGFVAAILGQEESADREAFVAKILGKKEPGSAGAFSSAILREYNFDPNEPRDERGRWTTGGGNATDPLGTQPGYPGYQGIGAMGAQINAARRARIGAVDAKLATFDAQRACYVYYEPAGVKQFNARLRAVLTGYVNDISEGWLDRRWGQIAGNIYLSGTIADTDPVGFIHELTHALDQKNGWNLSAWITTLQWGTLRKAEGLAYSAEHIINSLQEFEKFEDNVKAGRYNAYPDEARRTWAQAWHIMGGFAGTPIGGGTPVYVGNTEVGNLTNDDVATFERLTGVKFSYKTLAPLYQDLVNEWMKSPIQLPTPTSLPTCIQ
jgi:hypothetical protein